MEPQECEALTRQVAELEAKTLQLRAQLEQPRASIGTHQGQEARPPDDPEAIRARMRAEMRTTPADLQDMLGRDSYPTWMHAAYADLAGRLARVEDRLEDLEASMSLLHTKMEMLLGQLAVCERQDRAD